jgi:hypothetical protein
MASFNFNHGIRAIITGGIDVDGDTFKMLLLDAPLGETEKDTFDSRSDITNEVANGNGYATGGETVTVTVAAVDTANNDIEITCSAGSWPNATITAEAAVVYAVKGSAATDIPLAHIDFGGPVSSTNAAFTATPTGSLKFQN